MGTAHPTGELLIKLKKWFVMGKRKAFLPILRRFVFVRRVVFVESDRGAPT
jgi:hypothetical protein